MVGSTNNVQFKLRTTGNQVPSGVIHGNPLNLNGGLRKVYRDVAAHVVLPSPLRESWGSWLLVNVGLIVILFRKIPKQ